jgi:hypothetical protein
MGCRQAANGRGAEGLKTGLRRDPERGAAKILHVLGEGGDFLQKV